jgi:hypothetical protein
MDVGILVILLKLILLGFHASSLETFHFFIHLFVHIPIALSGAQGIRETLRFTSDS